MKAIGKYTFLALIACLIGVGLVATRAVTQERTPSQIEKQKGNLDKLLALTEECAQTMPEMNGFAGSDESQRVAHAWGPDTEIFFKPTTNGYRLAWCLHQGTECGEPAATAWCKAKGYSRAIRWEMDPDIGASSPTYVIGDEKVCDSGDCDGFEYITCGK